MSGKIKIDWIHEGFEEILCSSGAKQVCEQQAGDIQARANAGLRADDTPGYKTDGKIVNAYGSKRWMYFVYTTDAATVYAEAEDNVLSKAVSG